MQVINLLVTPEQAELLSLASAQTQIQLVLRNPMDHEVTKTPGTALSLLFNGGKLKPEVGSVAGQAARAASRAEAIASAAQPVLAAAPKKEEPFVMEIISGTKKAEQKFTHVGEGK